MKKLVLVSSLSLLPAALVAQPGYGNPPGLGSGHRIEFTPHVSYHFGGDLQTRNSGEFPNDVRLDDGVGYGASFDFPLGGDLQLELYFDHQDADVVRDSGLFDPNQTLAEVGVSYGHVGLVVNFGDPRVSPFFVGSAGVTNLDPKGPGTSADTKFSVSLGGGVKAFLSDNIGFRLEGRYFWTYLDNYNSGGCYGGCRDNNTDYLSQWQASAGLIFAW